VQKGVSFVGVMVNLMKCAVGAGSFSVPYAFKVWLPTLCLSSDLI
jgi:amino acid permease